MIISIKPNYREGWHFADRDVGRLDNYGFISLINISPNKKQWESLHFLLSFSLSYFTSELQQTLSLTHVCYSRRMLIHPPGGIYQVSLCTYGNHHNLWISLFRSLFPPSVYQRNGGCKYLTMSVSGAEIYLVRWKIECLFSQRHPVLLYSIMEDPPLG